MTTPADIAAGFQLPRPVLDVRRFGSGHVNDTYAVTTGSGRFLLQRINTRAFAHPDQVMHNIVTVTAHLGATVTDPRRALHLIPTVDGGWWHVDDAGGWWRMYAFIEGSAELEAPVSPAEMRRVGAGLGAFLVQLDTLPADRLFTTIPAFHDEPRYVARLRAAVAADPCGRAAGVADEIAHALAYETASHDFDDPALMPLRVTHNDAKVANVLVDAATGEPLCVVDLDTVQPGLAVNDVGDAIRSGAASAAEDDPDLAHVRFVPELFEAFLTGYLGACGAVLAPGELAHLRHGVRMMTLETSLRFLTDHIEGDVYYRIDRAGHNLDRARNQLALLDDIQAHWDWMGGVIARLTDAAR